MRAAAFTDLGGPDGVSMREVDAPEPGPGEAVVAVEASTINRHDLWILEGDSAMVDADALPFVSGLDLAGVVDRAGEGADVEPGERVVLCPNETCGTCRFCREGPENRCEAFSLYHGAFADEALVPADRLVPLPAGVGATAAACLPTAYVTAWHMIRRAGVDPGDLVLVPGATGGVGLALVQLLEVLGGRSIAASRSASKLERVADRGADHVVAAADPQTMVDAVAEIGAPTAVLSHLGGGGYLEAALEVLERGDRAVVCGRTAGDVGEVPIADLYLSHKSVLGSTMGTQADLERLVGLVADGALEPAVADEFGLESIDEAFAAMRDSEAVGKLVVHP